MARRSKGENSSEGIPLKPPGWQSASELRKKYPGGDVKINQRIEELRQELITDVMNSLNLPAEEAESIVAEHLVGVKRPQRGQSALAVSGDALPLLERKVQIDRRPEGWQGVTALQGKYKGNYPSLGRKLREFADRLASDIEVTLGCSHEEAVTMVEHNLIARNTGRSGAAAIAASPDARRAAEQFGILEIRDEEPGSSGHER